MVNLLIGVTGSVATIKLSQILEGFIARRTDIDIKVIVTETSKHFLREEIVTLPDGTLAIKVLDKKVTVPIFDDSHEWKTWNQMGDPVEHIEFRKWADVFLICPLGANTLGKIATGLCDNLLTCIIRAWEIHNPQKKMIVAPAMNTIMWEHPFTAKHLDIIKDELKIIVLPPVSKTLACGDTGVGAMASVEDIVTHTVTVVSDLDCLACLSGLISSGIEPHYLGASGLIAYSLGYLTMIKKSDFLKWLNPIGIVYFV